MKRIAATLLGLLASAVCLTSAAAEGAVIDGNGCLRALSFDGAYCDIRAQLRFPSPGWSPQPGQDSATDTRVEETDTGTIHSGRVRLEEGGACSYTQISSETDGALRIDYAVTADTDVALEGIYLFIDVFIAEFAGGMGFVGNGADNMGVELPVEQPVSRHFISGNGGFASLTDASENKQLEVRFEPTGETLTMQDTREWGGATYALFFPLARGDLAAGQTVSGAVTLALTGQADHSPASLTLDSSVERYQLDGFGGNYCFNIESPVTQYTLSNLNVRWARTEMTPGEWEPENDNDSPDATDMEKLAANDKPGSNLRREFELAKQIQDKGIPYVISIWHLPEWLYADPGKGPEQHGRIVPAEKWPEMLECIGAYLVYAKQQYGVEPDLFSFNEPDYGVRVKFTGETHRDAVKAFGRHFDALGLKTRMLLADLAHGRGQADYCRPALEDEEARSYIGAVAYHPWGGASLEDYEAWAAIAEGNDLPLLITEVGTDAGAWRTRAYDSYQYAMGEVKLYQELLLYARPTGAMQWEFTADYGVARETDAGIQPTVRYDVVRHFCNLTPTPSTALGVSSDAPDVLFTAFAGDGPRELTLHIANCGPERTVTVRGIPEWVRELRVVRTSEDESFADQPSASPQAGVCELLLPAQSFTTLTTLGQ